MCPRSSDLFYIVTYCIKWVNTSWTHTVYLMFSTPKVFDVWIVWNLDLGGWEAAHCTQRYHQQLRPGNRTLLFITIENILSVPNFTANLFCIWLSMPKFYTVDAVQICDKFWDTQYVKIIDELKFQILVLLEGTVCPKSVVHFYTANFFFWFFVKTTYASNVYALPCKKMGPCTADEKIVCIFTWPIGAFCLL